MTDVPIRVITVTGLTVALSMHCIEIEFLKLLKNLLFGFGISEYE